MDIDKEFWVITLYETEERTKYVEDLLINNNFKYKLFKFSRHEIPWKGCLNSHIFLYREALKKNLDYIIILEDNVTLSHKYDKSKYENLFKIANTKKDWDVIIFGGFIMPLSACHSTEYPELFKTIDNYGNGTSAYLISKKGYIKALLDYDKQKINIPIDVYLSKIEQYIYNPILFHHRIIPSTVNSYLDIPRKFWFKPKVYECVEFLYFNGKLRLIIYILSGIFLILFIFLFVKIVRFFI